MKHLVFAFIALALGACTANGPKGNASAGTSPNAEPSVTEPGLHISGSARVGVVKRY